MFVVVISIASFAINQEKENAKESMPSLVSPKGHDDEWSKWIVGEWEGTAKSDMGKYKDWVTGKGWAQIEFGLNGQFLIMKFQAKITQMSNEYIQYLKETMNMSDEDIEKIRNSTFEEINIQTIDPKTGEIVGYLFDSLRCVAKGKGRREENKEIMEWQWSVCGQGTSIQTTEKVSDDKFIFTEKYTLPDGSVMEDKGVMTRKKITTEKGKQ
ncbi:MAG: hypothetical protein A2173_05470 [Planctomycetes bacterium RBG_13_44_8b]|nr:MAG: hypothetical protein A2173_05470 [Planctomycetes bacterium RBG_13_44_8b]